MPRDSSGKHNLPSGNPVASGTIIESGWANTTMTDVSNGLSESLSRTGNGGMLAPLKLPDGAESFPSLVFTSEVQTGFYKSATNELMLAVEGLNAVRFRGEDIAVWSQADAQFYSVSTAKNAGGVSETQTLTALQTVVPFTAHIAGASLFLNSAGDDNGRLLEGDDYTYDPLLNEVTLTTAYSDGAKITAVYNDNTVVEEASAAASASANAAVVAQGLTETARDESVAAKDAALVAESNAAGSADAAAADAAQTAADRVQTGNDAIQSGLNAVSADTARINSENAAAAASASESAASASASTASSAKTASEVARDESVAAKDAALVAESNAAGSAGAAAADAAQTAADRVQTGNDVTQSGLNAVSADSSAGDALVSENKASQWADEAEDTPVEAAPDRFSALHWAKKAMLAATPSFPAGTLLAFPQASAPSGWTQVTGYADKALRLVDGAGGGVGGSVAFTNAFKSQGVSGTIGGTTAGGAVTVNNHTLSVTAIPSHNHTYNFTRSSTSGTVTGNDVFSNLRYKSTNTGSKGSTGAHNHGATFTGSSHSHVFTGDALNLAVEYVDFIVAEKD